MVTSDDAPRMPRIGANSTDLCRAMNSFKCRVHERHRARARAEDAALELHAEMLAAYDRGESIEDISDQLGLPEDVTDNWLGALVRGRDRAIGGIPAPLYNAERFAADGEAA